MYCSLLEKSDTHCPQQECSISVYAVFWGDWDANNEINSKKING